MDQNLLVKWTSQRQLSIPTLLLKHYKQLGIKEEELVALLHIQSCIEEGDGFPTPEFLSERMTLQMNECADMLGRLIRMNVLSLEKKWDEQGILFEFFSLEPLWLNLIQFLKGEQIEAQEQTKQSQEGLLYTKFEEEFCRPLSPIEAETLSMWLDQDSHSYDLIIAALREAVVSGKLNFRYIDRILFEWKRNGIKTLDQAKAHGEKFRKYNNAQTKQEPKRPRADSYPSFSWLDKS
ncbi:DnaD domain-containing protein [Halalkalibacter akibai]|uniref:Chromosome replication initiation protein dnaD n=1 Tax=Halalkalibacter akibai (strain ATCC 43226 / DSM 21942 / CIP 109018 / JCM 9157 / 1139) TaxID=1236973 RepID=W4QSJ8_HALA3|nr:DnaD domain-containing protein [Halalkalibacter akibai]GAE34598.1 chromosome replication initiation protein dnaD [Halalkalibacter akibai JCM 9157]